MTISRDFTATTFVVQNRKTLLLWHNKIQAWLPPGGHIEEGELPEEAALREVVEETGLEVEFVGAESAALGNVTVLRQPACILLEDINPSHQHIDLIYFARVSGGTLSVDPQSASDFRWCSLDGLDAPEIPEDIRALGRNAIAVAAHAAQRE